jgi:gamma-glutamyltranspeptidase/glutathione hydrolase
VKIHRLAFTVASSIIILGQSCFGSSMSPTSWPEALRADAEQKEAAGIWSLKARSLSGKNCVIAATASPIAVQSGIQALKNGGNAADAAATVALTQVTTQLGSVVSFAGIMSLVYFDAKSKKVYSMDAGYNSYRQENDPASIPISDLGVLNTTDKAKSLGLSNNYFRPPSVGGKKGRETLVPGFMAGIEAMHNRFGKLPFSDLFEPAIWYAEHGTIINSHLQYFFSSRQKFLARTPEGQQFIRQAGNDTPQVGDRFMQPQLAATLRGVVHHGAKYMYTGAWGQHFVNTIRREGGKVCSQDMSHYHVIWSEPLSTTYLGHQVVTAGLPSHAAYHVLTGLNLAEALKLEEHENYWQDPAVLCDFQRISDATNQAPTLDKNVLTILKNKGIDCSPKSQLTKQYASALVPLLNQLYVPSNDNSHHSNAIVVIDQEGNIAAITHSINTVIWGDTGIVVDGIPIPDSAGFQQEELALLKPGDRLPNDMMPTIVFEGLNPILSTAAIGMSLIPETIRIIVGLVGKKVDLKTLQEAPPVISNFLTTEAGKPSTELSVVIAKDSYDEAFIEGLKRGNAKVTIVPAATASGALRGTAAAVTIDPQTGDKRTVETPGVLIYGASY